MRTVKGNPEEVLRVARLLHPISRLKTKTPNAFRRLAFWDLETVVFTNRKVNSGWYRKPADTGTILNLGSCTILTTRQIKQAINGTVHRVCCSKFFWENSRLSDRNRP